ncbi:glycosyltransferase [Xanthomonas hortorum]|uniref:O-mycaminosyltylonolide 6-deoxyallosyltransferase n=1 Tax=Xanthomonas hortorum pv. gardneri TaxID=2754056 RepID=A0A6V7EWY4_9XANT|nr:glycosyltransferase [Xanthomonas hortorum]MCC4625643.1 glycosyltransferase [Xanthomonas campestris pv. nigromaculans]APP79094.1 glucosyltransferase [Xanthomonas hortorum pv. gardneri]EGD20669.1 glycosyl transferase, UDP-glucuronosyltransferase [Xanthomonas hortorum ATCC 19865]KLA96306.1 glucosyltransferase [Xanthomonas hortorum pv. gardneri]KLA99367.1 glucosyltransferase [Xanthomonas hortorum pv. gardneri]
MPESLQTPARHRPVLIATLGTHGDVRPIIALGRGLQERGYPVRVLTSANFESLIRANGLEFFPLSGDHQKLLQGHPNVAEMRGGWRGIWGTLRAQLMDWARDWAEQGRAACADAGLILGVGSASLLAHSLGQAYGLPVVFTQLQPLNASRHVPLMVMPTVRLPGLVSVALHHAVRFAAWQLMRPALNGIVRPALGLPAYPWSGPDRSAQRVVYGYSEHLCPRPPDWPDRAQVAGFWQLPQPQWQPPAALEAFLQAGPPALYVGFGSMISIDAAQLTAIVKAAVRLTGQRALLASGWGGLAAGEDASDDAERFFQLEQAPHDWLFPRVSVAVHHGGAGTTGAALAAGIPSVVLPFGYDQPFWAHCLAQRGVAPPALARVGLQPETLADAIRQASAPSMRAAARVLGQRIREEDGISRAVDQLEAWGLLQPAVSVAPTQRIEQQAVA